MGGGGTDHNQNALSFWKGTSQHADYDANQGEVNSPYSIMPTVLSTSFPKRMLHAPT